jgi:hypothetical protein
MRGKYEEDDDDESWHGAREDGRETAAFKRANDGAQTELEGEAKSRVGEEVGSRLVRSRCSVIRTQTGRPIRDHGKDDSVADREQEEPSTPIREASAVVDQRKSEETAGGGEELEDNAESDTVSDVRFGKTGERTNVASHIRRSSGETQEEPTERQERTEKAGWLEVDGSGPRAPITRNRVPAPRKPGRSP